LSLSKTTCPLDCYDGCSIAYEGERLKGDKGHPVTRGSLCSKMYGFLEHKRVDSAYYKGEKISLAKALEILKEKILQYKNEENLYLSGSGNLGKMQNITKNFFSKCGYTAAKGSLCDGAGDAGIKEGRGANLLLPISQIEKSEVVIIWGRNPSVSNRHILPFLKDKKIIIIDPRKISLTQEAVMHFQLKPRSDIYLALLIARVLYMTQEEDVDFIEKMSDDFDDFVELFESIPIKELSKRCGVEIDEVYNFLDIILGKKTVFLVGIGVQKYTIGHYVLRAIDSLGAMLGLFGKEGCGVGYLSDSSYGFKNPFLPFKKSTPLPSVDFSKYSMVFIQNSNPIVSLPDTKRVLDGLKKSKFIVYFGLYENETFRIADLVLPAVTFLAKSDIKTTYGHEYVGLMPKIRDEDGISEYNLTRYLMSEILQEELESENFYIDEILHSNSIKKGEFYISKSSLDAPYKDGFITDSGKFCFLDDFEDDFEDDFLNDEGYYILSVKHKKALNSSFFEDEFLYVPKESGLKDGDRVEAVSTWGKKAQFVVKVDESLRKDCVMAYCGNRRYNYLTSSMTSFEGDCAVFQEMKVDIKRVS